MIPSFFFCIQVMSAVSSCATCGKREYMCLCVQAYSHSIIPMLDVDVKQKKHNFCWHDVFLFLLEYQLVIRECFEDEGHATAIDRFYGPYDMRLTHCHRCPRGMLHIIHKHLFHSCAGTVFYSMLLTQSFFLLSSLQTHHHPWGWWWSQLYSGTRKSWMCSGPSWYVYILLDITTILHTIKFHIIICVKCV